MKFHVVYLKNKKKIDKWFKKNNLSNKIVIDIEEILAEENLPVSVLETHFFKLLIWKRMELAFEKGKDIFYIPMSWRNEFEPSRVLSIKKSLPRSYSFSCLVFYDDMRDWCYFSDCLTKIDFFDTFHIVEE